MKHIIVTLEPEIGGDLEAETCVAGMDFVAYRAGLTSGRNGMLECDFRDTTKFSKGFMIGLRDGLTEFQDSIEVAEVVEVAEVGGVV